MAMVVPARSNFALMMLEGTEKDKYVKNPGFSRSLQVKRVDG